LIRACIPAGQVRESKQQEYDQANLNLLLVDRIFGDRLFIDSSTRKRLKTEWQVLFEETKSIVNSEEPNAAQDWYQKIGEYVDAVLLAARKDLGMNDESE